MKKLDHGCVRKPDVPERNMRKFFTRGTVAVGLLATLGFGGMATGIIAPKTAAAETSEKRQVGGKLVPVYHLEESVAVLDGRTQQYRRGETREKERNGERYAYNLQVPEQKINFTVSCQSVKADFNGDGNQVTLRNWMLVAKFPKERERNPKAEGAGVRVFEFGDFSEAVRNVSGQEMTRVHVVMETGTFDNKGTETWYANIHVFPVNASGDFITKKGSNEYLAFTASFYDTNVAGGAQLLVEPGKDTRIAKR